MEPAVPEIDVQTQARKLQAGENFTIVDVREPWEIELVHLTDERVMAVPVSRIVVEGPDAFPEAARDPQAEIVVLCHHGVRSARMTDWMQQNGWKKVASLHGGIAAYAEQIDPSIGTY